MCTGLPSSQYGSTFGSLLKMHEARHVCSWLSFSRFYAYKFGASNVSWTWEVCYNTVPAWITGEPWWVHSLVTWLLWLCCCKLIQLNLQCRQSTSSLVSYNTMYQRKSIKPPFPFASMAYTNISSGPGHYVATLRWLLTSAFNKSQLGWNRLAIGYGLVAGD